MSEILTPVGLDVGFGFTKIVVITNAGPRTLTFPSVLGLAEAIVDFALPGG